MTNEKIKSKIESGKMFFGVSSCGRIFARYVSYGPVYEWEFNQMVECPLQGEDLIWMLESSKENSE